MIIAAFCPTCSEERARSRDLEPGRRAQAADFTPVQGQIAPVDGEPATCSACKATLVFRRVGQEQANGHASSAPVRVVAPGVKTLFSLEPGEEIRQVRELSPDVQVVFTNRRIVRLNLMEMLEES